MKLRFDDLPNASSISELKTVIEDQVRVLHELRAIGNKLLNGFDSITEDLEFMQWMKSEARISATRRLALIQGRKYKVSSVLSTEDDSLF